MCKKKNKKKKDRQFDITGITAVPCDVSSSLVVYCCEDTRLSSLAQKLIHYWQICIPASDTKVVLSGRMDKSVDIDSKSLPEQQYGVSGVLL